MNLKRHSSDNQDKELYIDDSIDESLLETEIFKKDKDFFFIFKKTKRLVSALYLLTDLFPEKEPLKWFLREHSLRIIPDTVNLKFFRKDEKSKLENLQNDILKLMAFMESAYLGNLISNMNFSIFSMEFVKVINLEEEYFREKSDRESRLNLSEEFFFEHKGHYKGQSHIKDKSDNLDPNIKGGSYIGQNFSFSGLNIRENNKNIQKSNIEKSVLHKNHKNIEKKQKKSDRQIKIIDLIKSKREVSIKDISDYIKDCSEKTIQRELLLMVKSGVLKKVGKKRWSKYSLNL